MAPVSALLQDLQRKGLGSLRLGDLGRLGCATHQGNVDVECGVGADSGIGGRQTPEQIETGDQPHRGIRISEVRSRHDVGTVCRTGQFPGWRGSDRDQGPRRSCAMSMWNAVWEPIRASVAGKRRNKSKQVTSLIEEFEYPKFGPGMMWERCTEQVIAQGGEVRMETKVTAVHVEDGNAVAVTATSDGSPTRVPASHVISSMPFTELARIVDPPVPAEVLAAASELHYRDFLTVALVIPENRGFPDNWIYIHAPDVRVGRIQNFGSWSPFLVKDGRTCLGMEYFVFEGDDLWTSSDDELVALGTKELAAIGLVDA